MIDVIDKLKREKAQNDLMMETSDFRLIKERAPNAIISHKKYSNPHISSQPSINTVVRHPRAESFDNGKRTASIKRPPKPVMVKRGVVSKIDRFILEKSTIQDQRRA